VHRIIRVLAPVPLSFALSCAGGNQSNPLVVNLDSPPTRVLDGCERAQRKCTVCHTIERILHSKVPSASAWKKYVRRMRRMPGAGISSTDEPLIVDCLVFRSFGNEGLIELKEASK